MLHNNHIIKTLSNAILSIGIVAGVFVVSNVSCMEDLNYLPNPLRTSPKEIIKQVTPGPKRPPYPPKN